MKDLDHSRRYVTNSELQTFKACRRRWFLEYYRRLTPIVERPTGPLRLGSRVHEALEAHYSGGDCLAAHVACVERDRALLATDLLPEEVAQFESESVLGRLMLEGYLEWLAETGADQGLEVIAAETKLSAPLDADDPDGVWLLGKLDLRVRREVDGSVWFLDHKTAKAFSDVFGTVALNEQFLSYQLLERLALVDSGDDRPPATGSLVNVLRKVKRTAAAKPPFYAREAVYHSDMELRSFWWRLRGTVTDLRRVEEDLAEGVDHRLVAYPRPSRDCSWACRYRDVCPMLDDGSDAERFLADRFTVHDPLTRYADDVGDEGDQP